MNSYKVSRFNSFYNNKKDSDSLIVYNSFRNSLSVISKEEYNCYKQLEDNYVNGFSEELLEKFYQQGILIDESFDEFDILKLRTLKGRLSPNSLSLTIAPTMQCNFDCIYCYEKGIRTSKKMDLDVQDKIVNFINEKVESIKSLGIAWYGGEPLLAIDVIKNLSEKFINICKNNKMEYYSSIVTNGYLLTREVAEVLKSSKINQIQITIDGPKDVHDSRRYLINSNKPTFDKIVNNIKNTYDILKDIEIYIRINVDKDNVNRLNELVTLFNKENLLDKVTLYLGYVENTNDCYNSDDCIDYEKYMELDKDFINHIAHIKNSKITSNYPVIKNNVCGAELINNYVITPNGNLYKCWSDIGQEEYCVGNILEEDFQINKTLTTYLLYDVSVLLI